MQSFPFKLKPGVVRWSLSVALFAFASGSLAAQTPSISSTSPSLGPPGVVAWVYGSNFGASQGISTVAFNGTPATVTCS